MTNAWERQNFRMMVFIIWQNGHSILDIAKGLNCTGAEGILSKYYKAETVRA